VASIKVDGSGASWFHYLPESIFITLGSTNAARTARVGSSSAYGPYQTGTWVDVLVGTAYIFLPACGRIVRFDGSAPGQINYGQQSGRVVVRCPQ
jgi:hypothetical protein